MSAREIRMDWMELRVRHALRAGCVDLAQMAVDFGMSEKWVSRLAARCANEMRIEWVSPNLVVRH